MPQPGTPGVNRNVRGASNVSVMIEIDMVYYDVIRVFYVVMCVVLLCRPMLEYL